MLFLLGTWLPQVSKVGIGIAIAIGLSCLGKADSDSDCDTDAFFAAAYGTGLQRFIAGRDCFLGRSPRNEAKRKIRAESPLHWQVLRQLYMGKELVASGFEGRYRNRYRFFAWKKPIAIAIAIPMQIPIPIFGVFFGPVAKSLFIEELPMKYEGMIYRPPSEANSLILQVAVGCSYNRCTFCHSFQGKSFRIKSFEEIKEDIDEISPYGPIPRVFLADGDALIIPQQDLVRILSYLKLKIQGLERVGIYANAVDILKKSVDELKELKSLGLGIIYLGLESGNPEVLKRIKKNATAEQMIRAAKRVKEAGIVLSVTVLLGIGGVELSHAHAEDTGKILSEMDPEYVGALSLIIVPGTPIAEDLKSGRLVLPTPFELIRELGTMIANCQFTDCFFASNHASNYLPLRIRMPREKERALELIREVLERKDPELLRPEYMRAL